MKNIKFLKPMLDFFFAAKAAFSEWVLEDGTLISIDDTTMIVSRMNDSGSWELLPEGSYTLIDGSVIKVDAESKVVMPDQTPAMQEEVVNEEVEAGKRAVNEEQFNSHVEKQMELFSNANLKLQNENIALQEKLKEQTEKFEKLNKELEDLKKTSVEKFRTVEKVITDKAPKNWAEILKSKRN